MPTKSFSRTSPRNRASEQHHHIIIIKTTSIVGQWLRRRSLNLCHPHSQSILSPCVSEMAIHTHPKSKDKTPALTSRPQKNTVIYNPSDPLPRDGTGRYLHLKLKRFPSIRHLTMPYARKTWQETPHDAGVGMAPNARSSCRWCHGRVEKGSLRYKLFLQCHKGCKIPAYFHADCIWKYPETAKLDRASEVKGLEDLPGEERTNALAAFEDFAKSKDAWSTDQAACGTTPKRLADELDSEAAPVRSPKRKRVVAQK
jgi:hypothetical protein